VGIAAEYAHPIEFALGNMIPAAIPCMLLGSKMHFITYFFWATYRLGETIDGHSGYEFSWSPYRLIPFSASA
jgi:sterol desaturase/sphingolipid hydroxylase (fatty acid hydroxylase superfamily)